MLELGYRESNIQKLHNYPMKSKTQGLEEIPEFYQRGVAYVMGLTQREMVPWLKDELSGKMVLPPDRDNGLDHQVGMIINHYYHLPFRTQRHLNAAINSLVFNWKQSLTESLWTEENALALFNLAAALHISEVKYKLRALVEDGAKFATVSQSLQPSVFTTIASLSENSDRKFWHGVVRCYPKYAGLVFQVFARIAPEDALIHLGNFPVAGSIDAVARVLPDFISRFQAEETQKVIARVLSACKTMSRGQADVILAVLVESRMIGKS